MLQLLAEPSTWVAFATLSLLEVVLGIDNIIFLAILVGRLPPRRQPRARVVGLGVEVAHDAVDQDRHGQRPDVLDGGGVAPLQDRARLRPYRAVRATVRRAIGRVPPTREAERRERGHRGVEQRVDLAVAAALAGAGRGSQTRC